jgi:hypothetical protein
MKKLMLWLNNPNSQPADLSLANNDFKPSIIKIISSECKRNGGYLFSTM